MTHRASLKLLATIAWLGSTASADVINVPDDYLTIQQAIYAAVDGDEIIVLPGVYVEDIDFLRKDIIVRSTEPTDPDVVAATIIDGNHNPQNPGTVVTLSAGTISGFRITGGYGDTGNNPGGDAGGVFATDSSTVTYNLIKGNFAPGIGGGIYATDNAIVANNSILQNQCTSRGGGAWLGGNVVFTNNIVADNRAFELDAGGIHASWNVRITNCLIDSNQANSNHEGGGVWLSGDSVLEGCTITNNSASTGSGVLALGRSIVRNNIITGNSGGRAVWLRDGGNENFVLFTGNIVADNIGTGLKASGHAVVHTNVIKGNLGGVGSVGGASVTGSVLFANNAVLSNSGDIIGGVLCNNDATVVNNIVAFAVSGGGILKPPNFVGLEDYNCVFGNVGGDYSDKFGADDTPGPHDILEDPRLVFLDHHLMPDSPCIDAGIGDLAFDILSGSDIDSQPRVQSCNVDIGAHEFPGPFTAVLTVASSLPTGEVEVNLPDCNRDSDGFGQFNRFYTGSEFVTLTVLDTGGFDRWVINGADQPKGEPSATVDMSDDTFAAAVYSVIQVPKNSPTIQDAINAATEGTVIIVDEGTYVEDIDFLGKSLTVRSTDPMDWDVVAGTIIDGSKPGTITTVVLDAGEVAGFTIRDGYQGVEAEGDAVVRRCIITQNNGGQGAGVAAKDFSVIANNIIIFNGNDSIGGGMIVGLYVTAVNNVIAFNTAGTRGGGIYVASSSGLVVGNTVVANAAFDRGGGIYVRDFPQEQPFIANNIIAFSTAGGGIDADFNAITDYNCVFGNTGGDYVGPQGPGPNDVNKDPLLDVDGIHLLPDSPCIDAGDPDFVPTEGETDIDGEPRVIGARVDIGADESPNLVGDLNGDGTVGAADLLILLVNWGVCAPCIDCPADLNGDCTVGATDLLILLTNWG